MNITRVRDEVTGLTYTRSITYIQSDGTQLVFSETAPVGIQPSQFPIHSSQLLSLTNTKTSFFIIGSEQNGFVLKLEIRELD